MKKFRIIPDHNNTAQLWALEEKKGLNWKKIMRDENLDIVKRMKDHLLKPAVIYTAKSNTPEKPLRKNPSTWLMKPKLKRLKIKRSELPPSLQ